MSKPLVAYFRVSPREPRLSGLGIDAPRAAVSRFAAPEGYEIVGEFVEIETGKGEDAIERRPQLAEALAEARARTARARTALATPARRALFRRALTARRPRLQTAPTKEPPGPRHL